MKKIIVVLLSIAMCLVLLACGKRIVWDDLILGDMLPEPPIDKGEIHTNTAKELRIDVNNISDKQFADYIEACKEKGFTVDAKSDSNSYDAYDKDGYKLRLSKIVDTSISLEAPMEMSNITWPTSVAGMQLPIPKSKIGNFSYEHDDNFFVYVGNTTRVDYEEYVNACSNKGFNIDYSKGDDYYYADNREGWQVSLRYEGYNIMSVRIGASSENTIGDAIITTSIADESEVVATTSIKEPEFDTTDAETKNDNTDSSVLNPDFKSAMDNYEDFMDEYVEFMKKYKDNPSDLGILTDYADYMSKYAEFVKDFEQWDDKDMNPIETAYYIEVQSRVNKKLLEVAY